MTYHSDSLWLYVICLAAGLVLGVVAGLAEWTAAGRARFRWMLDMANRLQAARTLVSVYGAGTDDWTKAIDVIHGVTVELRDGSPPDSFVARPRRPQ